MRNTVYVGIVIICLASWASAYPECRISTFGSDYRGTLNTTISGRQCQRWDEQTPHVHSYNDSRNYPDRDLSLAENYCRNPVPADLGGLWCYTTDPAVPREYCDVPTCSAFPECKMTASGESYRGQKATTATGVPCVPWSPDLEFEDNVCRNPDGKAGGPWCYTDVLFQVWDYCGVPFCKPSASCTTTPDGTEYVGTIATTRSGIHCQRWDDTVFHVSNYTSNDDFPDVSIADASDYCRNPRGDKNAPWCYTLKPGIEWDYCDIDLCAGCRLTTSGSDYAGTTSITDTSYICQRWDSQTPHAHNMTDPDRFPDKDLSSSSNYCRNPDGRAGGPWCYTTDNDVEWQSCDVPLCTASDDMKQPTRGVKHVVHIGIDGLHPCLVDAPSPNIMDRIAAEGAWTLNGRTVLESVSGPSWTAILCDGASERTGIMDNTWLPPWKGYRQFISPVAGNDMAIHCIFDVLKRQDHTVRTAAFYLWEFFQHPTSTGLPGRMDWDYYCLPTQQYYIKCDNDTATYSSDYFREVFRAAETSYTFIYQGGADEAGHDANWCSDIYLQDIHYIDSLVGYMLDVIEEEGMEDEVLVVLTSDHGGILDDHGGPLDASLTMPMFFRGPGIKKNYEMQFGVRNVDVAATIARAMGFRPSPWWKGVPLEQIFV